MCVDGEVTLQLWSTAGEGKLAILYFRYFFREGDFLRRGARFGGVFSINLVINNL